MKNKAEETVIAVERAIQELRAGRPVWLEIPGHGPLLFKASELVDEKGPQVLQEQAVKLLKLAQLLPQAEAAQEDGPWLRITAEQVDAYQLAQVQTLMEVAESNLPLKVTENARVKVFRPRNGMIEHLAILIGEPEKMEAPLVRVHSSCLTGDLLGSLRCDCGDQLQLALEMIAAEGNGVLCYLNQEGRGIGIGNKIRAYHLQEQGQDTLEANESLGFAADERDFSMAVAMLKKLGLHKVRLLTNNPRKVGQLSQYGMEVTDRVPLKAVPHVHNQGYLETKSKRLGHYF